MINYKSVKLVLTILFSVVGIGLLATTVNTTVAPKTATAQGVDNSPITTTWTASKFLNIQGPFNNDVRYGTVGPITIGVVKWHNETSQNGRVVYKEDWSADVPDNNNFLIFGNSTNGVNAGGAATVIPAAGFDLQRLSAHWLYGVGGNFIHESTNKFVQFDRRVIFTLANTPSSQSSVSNVGSRAFSAIGNNLFCAAGTTENVQNFSPVGAGCLAAVGSYGFITNANMGNANMGDLSGVNSYPTGFGALIPTYWTVTGTFSP